MKKSELKNGMIVKSSGGRYGVVCLKDATDENCIKFFYDPELLIEHGFVEKACYGQFIMSLDMFNEDLEIRMTKEEAQKCGETWFDEWGDSMVAWYIEQVFSLKLEWQKE